MRIQNLLLELLFKRNYLVVVKNNFIISLFKVSVTEMKTKFKFSHSSRVRQLCFRKLSDGKSILKNSCFWTENSLNLMCCTFAHGNYHQAANICYL
jgi:hypothetical protein